MDYSTAAMELGQGEQRFVENRGCPKRQKLAGKASPEDKQQSRKDCRERNRMHARNTRERKRAYLEDLQSQLKTLTEQKNALEKQHQEREDKESARHFKWIEILSKVMNMRAQGVMDEDQWGALLSEDFTLTLPVTPYRSFNILDVVNNRRVLLGVEGMCSDIASLMVMCDLLGKKKRTMETRVQLEYLLGCDTSTCYFNSTGFTCNFVMRSKDAMECGAACEVEQSGILRARFSEEPSAGGSNTPFTPQLEELEMCFDGIAFYHQLMRAAGEESFDLVPNTLEAALKDEKHQVVVTTARRPFRITHVNNAWTDLCGFTLEECKGKNLSILQGSETDMDTVSKLCTLSEQGFPASMIVNNYNKEGRVFRNHLRCYPVSDDSDSGEITHIVGHLSEVTSE